MPEIVLIVCASGGLALIALGVALWHTWKLEARRHHVGNRTDKAG